MSRKITLIALAIAVLALFAGVYFATDRTAEAGGNTVTANLHLFDAATGIRYSPGTAVVGSRGKLSRKGDEIWATIKTDRLPPGNYTNWWVVFNNPIACAGGVGGCNGDDVPVTAVNAAIFFATGGTVGSDGKGDFEAHLQEGGMAGLLEDQVAFGTVGGPGLMPGKATDDPAEVHYVIRYHGPGNTNLGAPTDETDSMKMTTTLGGGCDTTPPAKGPVGNYPCWDPQAVVFPMPKN